MSRVNERSLALEPRRSTWQFFWLSTNHDPPSVEGHACGRRPYPSNGSVSRKDCWKIKEPRYNSFRSQPETQTTIKKANKKGCTKHSSDTHRRFIKIRGPLSMVLEIPHAILCESSSICVLKRWEVRNYYPLLLPMFSSEVKVTFSLPLGLRSRSTRFQRVMLSPR